LPIYPKPVPLLPQQFSRLDKILKRVFAWLEKQAGGPPSELCIAFIAGLLAWTVTFALRMTFGS
jgi:hypothetical protein